VPGQAIIVAAAKIAAAESFVVAIGAPPFIDFVA
jgi:hypothetical protein